MLKRFFFETKIAAKPFPQKSILLNFDLNSFELSPSLSQKTVSNLSLKYLQNLEKYPF